MWAIVLLLAASAVAVFAKDSDDPLWNKGTNGEYGNLTEGDMIYVDEIGDEITDRNSVPTFYYWPEGEPIPYRFGDTVLNRDHVMAGIEDWANNTCLQFIEVADDFSGPHLIFLLDSGGCWSYVGMVDRPEGQEIHLTIGCAEEKGVVGHEIGHSLGMLHEQSRSDRDDNIIVAYHNIIDGYDGQFNPYDTLNYGVPYDYSSAMHYGGTGFSANGELTIITRNIFAQSVIGNRECLSFMDHRLGNLMYGCIDMWTAGCVSPPTCDNLGYVVENCTCLCPSGTSGEFCETVDVGFEDDMIARYSPNSFRMTEEGMVSTPGFPTPLQEGLKMTIIIEAPACQLVKLTFTNFSMYPSFSVGCFIDYLEIRSGTDMIANGVTYCEQDLLNEMFVSATNITILNFRGYPYTTSTVTNNREGFKATVQFIEDPLCATTPIIWNTTATDLRVRIYRPCKIRKISDNVYRVVSPRRRRGTCNIRFRTTAISFLKITPSIINIRNSESLQLSTVNGRNFNLANAPINIDIFVPTFGAILKYSSNVRSRTKSFNLKVEALTNPCQQVIELFLGDPPVTIGFPDSPYPENSICEWKLIAPTGTTLLYDFLEFDVGTTSPDCVDTDFVAIARSGARNYIADTDVFCGDNIPGSGASDANVMRILAYGRDGGTGFMVNVNVT